MSLMNIFEISHNFGGQDIFSDIAFSLEHNSRIGLIGANGSGKTTLFNILTGQITPHTGYVQQAKNLKIAYLSQEVELNEEQTLEECVSSAHHELNVMFHDLEQARQNVAKSHSEQNLKILQNLEEQFFQAGGYHFASEMKIVLAGLGFPQSCWHRKIDTFSGGEKTRIQFARILLSPKDIFLLDEPTNHLDFKMIYWLENYLVKQDKPYLIISHDRHFLDHTVNKIAEIKNKKIYITKGNYSIWEADQENRKLTQERLYKRQQKFIKETKDFIARNMAGQKVQQAKSRIRTLEKLEIIEKPEHHRQIKLKIQSSSRSGNDVYIFENADLGYPDNTLAKKVNLRIGYQDSIALVGANGTGKTTLLKCINGELSPLSGKAKPGASLKIGYYDQLHTELDDRLTVYETMQELMPGTLPGEILSWLARFSFIGDDVEKLVQVLSGGEKARLYLAKLIKQQPNFLILDEPTNHLDINTIYELENALQEYEGTIIFVSHDSYFIRKIAKKIWVLKDKHITETDKDIEEIFSESENTQKMHRAQYTKDIKKKVNPLILEKLMNSIEENQNHIDELKKEVSAIEEMYTQEEYYNDSKKLKTLRFRHLEIDSQLEILETKLEELETEYLEKSEEE